MLLGVFARVSGGFWICIYQSDFGIDLFFLGKNKAFLGPRCVWCGKTRVINLIGAFGVAKYSIFESQVRLVWQNNGN